MSYAPQTEPLKFLLNKVIGLEGLLAGCHSGVEPADVDAILEEAGKFAGDVLAPLDAIGDKTGAKLANGVVTTVPGWIDAYRGFAEGGWVGVAASHEHGGHGLPLAVASAVTELWSAANMAFGLCPMLSQAAIEVLEAYGTPSQKTKYLSPLIEGRWTGTMNLTEPQAGSDLSAVRAKAVPENGHYRISGQKIYITYGEHDMTPNILHLVLARLPDGPPGIKGISLFLVPKFIVSDSGEIGARNDIRCAGIEHKLGIHASPTCVLAYGDNDGAMGELIGEPHRGIEYMFKMMNNARLAVGVQGVGVAERAYQRAVAYARARVQGRPVVGPSNAAIIAHPDVRRMLATSKVRIEAARALTLEAAACLDRGRAGDADSQARGDLLIPIVKAWSTDLGVSVASTGLQVHGGMGFVEQTGAAQHYRDARIAPIYEGTNGIQAADLVGRKIIRDQGATIAALIADVRITLGDLADAPGDDAAALVDTLTDAVEALEECVAWLLRTSGRNPAAVAASATSFLDLAGITLGGWMHGRCLLAAQAALFAREGDPKAMDAVVQSANLYARHVLPTALSQARIVADGADSLLAYDEAAL